MEISWQILTHEITCAWNGKFCIPQLFPIRGQWKKLITKIKIKGPDNPTRQLLPIISTKCCSGDGERRKDKGCGGGPPSKTKLGATKLYVKDGVWQRKMVCVCDKVVCEKWCVKVVCERWCVTKLCVKDGVVKDCVCDKAVCEGWCGERWSGERWCGWKFCERERVTKLCVKDGVWQSGVWEMVCQRWCVTKLCVRDGVVKDGVWKMVWWKMVWDKVVCDKVVCERWCVKDGVWQSWVLMGVKGGVWKMVCERWCAKEGVSKMVCERCFVTKWCVKDGVWQSCMWKMVCQRWWVTKWCVKDGVPRLPRETKVNVTKCHACHAKCRGVTGD